MAIPFLLGHFFVNSIGTEIPQQLEEVTKWQFVDYIFLAHIVAMRACRVTNINSLFTIRLTIPKSLHCKLGNMKLVEPLYMRMISYIH